MKKLINSMVCSLKEVANKITETCAEVNAYVEYYDTKSRCWAKEVVRTI